MLVADEGQLWLVDQMKGAGELPADLVVKISVQMGAANPISIRLLEQLGAGTYNTPTDLSLPQIAAIRAAVDLPLDMYVEAPDDFGGFVRHYETPELIRIGAPLYVKLGLRNAPNIYPSGMHLDDVAIKLSRERVRRAALVMGIIQRHAPDAVMSETGADDFGHTCGLRIEKLNHRSTCKQVMRMRHHRGHRGKQRTPRNVCRRGDTCVARLCYRKFL